MQVGGEVAVGQVIGLIEAMKLFNEIKSDLAGRVVRLVAGERHARQGQAAAHRGGAAVSTTPEQRPIRAHVTGWGRYAPSQVLTNADLERMVDTSDEWIVPAHRDPRAAGRRGPRDDRVDGRGRRACGRSATAGIDPDDIDLILLATLTPDYWMPSTAALVKEAIGNTRAAAMDVAAACSGFVYAYATAQAYIHERHGQARPGHRRRAARRASSTTPTGAPASCSATAPARSSCRRRTSRAAASGIELTTEPAGRLHDLAARRRREVAALGRDDRARRALHPDGGQGDLPVRDADAGHDRPRRRSRGPGCEPADIDLFIPHQANIRIIEAVAKGLDLPMDRMFVNLDRYGNTSAASVPIALAEAVNEGRVKVGDRDRASSRSAPASRAAP